MEYKTVSRVFMFSLKPACTTYA